MIRKILIEGVRTHERTEIELGRLTCLVGPNGSGKSTVLQAFYPLKDKITQPAWQRSTSDSWRVEFENSEGEKSELPVVRIKPTIIGQIQKVSRVVPFRPESKILQAASEFKNAIPQLGPDGDQLAAVLATWKLSDHERFQEVVVQLKKVVPTLEGLRPTTTLIDGKPGFELLFDFHRAHGIPAVAVSEGTILALGLLTALHEVHTRGSQHSYLILIDDIDRGLHPDAQLELIKLLRALADQKDLQIVMTTHSPYIVDALAPEEVCVLALDETGTTRARMLSEIPGAERYRGMLSTGQLWSSQGESWVLDDQAKSRVS